MKVLSLESFWLYSNVPASQHFWEILYKNYLFYNYKLVMLVKIIFMHWQETMEYVTLTSLHHMLIINIGILMLTFTCCISINTYFGTRVVIKCFNCHYEAIPTINMGTDKFLNYT